MSTIVQIAHGWEARQVIAGGSAGSAAGNRLMLFGQNSIFVEGFVAFGGENEDQAVDVAKWLVGGAAAGTIWVSSYLDDHSYRVSGAVSVVEVGATVRSALTGAGFTISESTDPDDDITYPEYDIAIVGSVNSFGQTLADNDERADQLVDFVNDGGGLMLTKSHQGLDQDFFANIDTAFDVSNSSSFFNPGDELAYLTGATALHPVLFPDGRTVWRKYCNSVSVGAVDANHGEYSLDGFSEPYRQYATYSAHGDA